MDEVWREAERLREHLSATDRAGKK